MYSESTACKYQQDLEFFYTWKNKNIFVNKKFIRKNIKAYNLNRLTRDSS